MRVTCERAVDRLDLRRGVIDGSTITSGAITALSIDVSSASYPPDNAFIANQILTNPYICVSNADGTPLAYNIPVSAYDTGTGDFTISGGTFTLLNSTDTAPTGAYITFGKYTTTHTPLDRLCERYLVAYCDWKILGRDTASASKAKFFEDDLALIKKELTESYAETDHDEDEIQISNPDLMLW